MRAATIIGDRADSDFPCADECFRLACRRLAAVGGEETRMDRHGKPKKVKAEATRPLVRQSPKDPVRKVRDLEKRLADALEKLQARDLEVTQALKQQTATGEIMRAIAQAGTYVQQVFDTIVRSAAELCHAMVAGVFLSDGQMIYLPANYGSLPDALAAIRAQAPGRWIGAQRRAWRS